MKLSLSKSVWFVLALLCTILYFSCDTAIDPDSDSGDSVLTLYANYGENESVEQHFNSRAIFKIKDNPFSRKGYYFMGWTEKPSEPSALYGNLSEVAFSEDTSLYALWQIQTYKISYQMDYGKRIIEYPEEFTVESGATLNPVKEDAKYHFGGWYETEDFSGDPITKIDVGEVGDRTFYARWCGVATYHLGDGYFADNPDIFAEDKGYYTVRASYTLPVPRLPGYAFDGWYIDKSFADDGLFSLDAVAAPTLDLYAKWKEAEYTVTYSVGDAEKGNVPAAKSGFKYLDVVTVAENDGALSAKGKTFVGWNYDSNGKTLFASPAAVLTVEDDVDFSPAWRLDAYAQNDEDKVTQILLPQSVRELSEAVFADYTDVREVDTSSLAVIGKNAFKNCISLASVDLSAAQVIADGAFANCAQLSRVVLPLETATVQLGDALFAGCKETISFVATKDTIDFYRTVLSPKVVGKNVGTYTLILADAE